MFPRENLSTKEPSPYLIDYMTFFESVLKYSKSVSLLKSFLKNAKKKFKMYKKKLK